MDKYKLPSNHELFQNQSMAELTQEMYEDIYFKKAELEEAMDSGDKSTDRAQVLEQLNAVKRSLGEVEEVFDPLVDQWEKDLAEGRIPDLDAQA